MARAKSRPARWNEAISKAREIVEDIDAKMEDLQGVLGELEELKYEYQEWYDNMPDGFRGGATADKLEEVVNLDIDTSSTDLDEIKQLLDEAEGLELPRGHGRD